MKYCPICGKEYEATDHCPDDGAVLILVQPELGSLVGQVLKGSYRIEEQIGQGGMGVVYRGVQMALQRQVAIKVLLPEMQSSPAMIRRFFQEARLLSQLAHPHVVTILDFGNTETGVLFMVMELLDGKTLRDIVKAEGGLPIGRAKRLMEQICDGVAAAHDLRLIHRDLKPDNIFVAARQSAPETVKILDFGLARAVAEDADARLTKTGMLAGTAGFLAPEQITGGEADARSDIYALGAILYFMVTGSRAFPGRSLHEILSSQLREPPDVEAGELGRHPALGAVILRAMAREPGERFATATALAQALGEAVANLDPGLRLPVDRRMEDVIATAVSPQPSALRATELGEPVASKAPVTAGTGGTSSPPPNLAAPRTIPRPRSTRRWWTGVGLVAAALLLISIGFSWRGRDDRHSAAVPGRDTVAGAPSGEPILVGMSAAFSGPSRELGRAMQVGIGTSFAEANQAGGVAGRELRLLALDDGYEPARTVANMAELVLERRVVALLGNVGTPTAAVALPLALERDVLFFGAFSGAALLRKTPPDRLVFNLRASYAEETEAIVDHFIDGLGMEPGQIAVFAQEDAFGDEGYDGVSRALQARGHTAMPLRVGYRRNTQSVDSALEALRRQRGQLRGVVLVATYRPAAQLIAGLSRDGIEMSYAGLSFVGGRALAGELVGIGPRLAEGVIVTQVVPHFGTDLPGVMRYRELLAEHFPAEQPDSVSLEGFLAAETFLAALRAADGDLGTAALVEAIESLSDLDLGIGTRVQFGPQRHQGLDRVWGTVLDRTGDDRPLELISRER